LLFIVVGMLQINVSGTRKPVLKQVSPAHLEQMYSVDQKRLFNMMLSEWLNFSSEQQLGIGIQTLKQMRQEHLFSVSIRSEQDFVPWALALNHCLLEERKSKDKRIYALAQLCVKQNLQTF